MTAAPADCLGPPVLASAARIARHTGSGLWGRLSLPSIFFRHADARDDALALADVPCADGTGQDSHRHLTYAEVEAAIRRIAARFDACGLKPGDIVALQLPPQIEAPITLLACLGLGFIVCPMPATWRRHELEPALSRIGARAIVTWSDGTGCDRVVAACSAAFRVSSIRYVFAFGDQRIDGATPLSIDDDEDADSLPRSTFPLTVDANALAVITWDLVAPHGPRAIARSHNECIAAGMPTVLAASLGAGSTLLSPYALSGITGMAAGLIPWLMTGGLLALHRPFDIGRWCEQIGIYEPDFAPVPAALAPRLAAAAASANPARLPLIAAMHDASAINAAHRSPVTSKTRIDLLCLGEIAILSDRGIALGDDPGLVRLGRHAMGGANGPSMMELRLGQTKSGLPSSRRPLEISGAPVPSAILTVNSEGSGFRAAGGDDEFISTGLYAAEDPTGSTARLVGTDPEIIHHGAVALSLQELDRLYSAPDMIADAAALAIDDSAMGHRLAVAVVPQAGVVATLAGLADDLTRLGAASSKIPDRLIIVAEIPRSKYGAVDRAALADLIGRDAEVVPLLTKKTEDHRRVFVGDSDGSASARAARRSR